MQSSHKILLACLLAAFPFVVGTPHRADAQLFSRPEIVADNNPGSFSELADRLTPSVVNVSSTQKMADNPEEVMPEMPQFPPGSPFEDFFEEFLKRRDGRGVPQVPAASLGSGFIIDAENGYIITNNHVIRDAQEVRVTLHDDTTLTAEVIGTDEKTDIAVLKVDAKKKLTAASFGDSDKMKVGDWVLAIGNPFGLGGTVTAGIISARQRDIQSGPYDDFIQTDASINRGNSGGPMFNMKGEVIGINTAIFSPSGGSVGIGFAIPSSLAAPVVKQIIEFGRTRRGWIGVKIQSVSEEIAESLSLNKPRGALIASVNDNGPADKAGLKVGDIILRFNNQDVEEMRNLPRIVAETSIDTQVPVDIWRDGKVQTVLISVGELEKAEEDGLIETADTQKSSAQEKDFSDFGFAVTELNDVLRSEYAVPENVDGVLIINVDNMSEAAEKELLPGDVIVEINQKKVSSTADVQKAIDEAKENQKTSILLLLNREGNVRFTALKIENNAKKKGE
jgi:serine protease Do